MYRLAIVALVVALAIALIAFLIGRVMRMVDADVNRPVTMNGGAMPKIVFFLLLAVMVYAISTGAT